MRRVMSIVGVLLMLSVMISGCGGGNKSSSTTPAKSPETAATTPSTSTPSTAPATPVKSLGKVNIAPGPDGILAFMGLYLAESMGIFQQNGLEATTLHITGGNEAFKALNDGTADIALLSSDLVAANRINGANVVFLGSIIKYPGVVMIVSKDLEGKVKSISDVKGMKVGVSSIGGGTYGTLMVLLNKAGMTEKDVEIVTTKDQIVKMWDNGDIKVAFHGSPYTDELVRNGKAAVVYDFRTAKDTQAIYGSDYPSLAIATRQDVIDQKPEVVEAVVKSLLQANQFIAKATPEEIIKNLPQRYRDGQDPNVFPTVIASNVSTLTLDLKLDSTGLETVIRIMKQMNRIPADTTVDVKSMINGSFVERATLSLKK